MNAVYITIFASSLALLGLIGILFGSSGDAVKMSVSQLVYPALWILVYLCPAALIFAILCKLFKWGDDSAQTRSMFLSGSSVAIIGLCYVLLFFLP